MEKFYDRANELKALAQIEKQSAKTACFTVLTGRRRIGKTQLLKHFISDKKSAYLFTSRSAEKSLCEQWQKKSGRKYWFKNFW